MRTRIKICGITRPEHGTAAARLGADAIGVVFYAPSPRSVDTTRAREIIAALPPFVMAVGLFVNPAAAEVEAVLKACPITALQFHGDENPEFCASFGKPYLKAIRVNEAVKPTDLLEYAASFTGAAGYLFDAYNDNLYGGTGEAFDWDLIPRNLQKPLVLSGGLNPGNVGEAVKRTRPWAVDVSSGVESAKGIKDEQLMAAFIAGVRNADV